MLPHEDLAEIDAAILRSRVKHLAELARQESVDMEPYAAPAQPTYQPAQNWPVREADQYYSLDAPAWAQPWYRRRSTHVAVGLLAVAGVVAVAVWAILGLISAASEAVAGHASAIEGIGVLVIGLFLLSMLGGRHGGGKFSGTFTGRMH